MDTDSLIYQNSPKVNIATNTFINVPVILQYEDTRLIEIVKEAGLGFTTQIPIYHSDGTKLASVKGTRMFLTEDGKKAGLAMDKLPGMVACKMGTQTLFEIYNQPGDAFRTVAELHTPDGYFVKCNDQASIGLINSSGNSLQVGGMVMMRSTIKDYRVGILLSKNGSCTIGVN